MNRLPRSETLLVLACAAGAAVLAGSQFTTMFELTPPGGEALATVEASDQHGYATLVLAVFALAMLVVGIAARTESLAQIAAFAVAAAGAVALLIFLISDLPDANRIGTLDDARESFIDAKAEPAAGFWFELAGSLVLAICGGALATLGPESLSIGTRGRSKGPGQAAEPGAAPGKGRRRPRAGKEGDGAVKPSAPVSAPKQRGKPNRAGLKLPSMPKLSIGGRSKRIGRANEKSKDQEPAAKEGSGDEGFKWPSRPGRDD